MAHSGILNFICSRIEMGIFRLLSVEIYSLGLQESNLFLAFSSDSRTSGHPLFECLTGPLAWNSITSEPYETYGISWSSVGHPPCMPVRYNGRRACPVHRHSRG